MARYVRGYSDARATIGLALWYPILVLALAYGLFVGLVSLVVPRFVAAFDSLHLTASPVLHWLNWLGETGRILVARRTDRAGRAGDRLGPVGNRRAVSAPTWMWLRLFPWMKSILANYETANFSELLALLLEHRVPYPSALVLAAEATGNPRLTREPGNWPRRSRAASRPRRPWDGRPERHFSRCCAGSWRPGSSRVRWSRPCTTSATLSQARQVSRPRSSSVFLPTILMFAIGGSATLLYGLALFLPVINMLRELSVP